MEKAVWGVGRGREGGGGKGAGGKGGGGEDGGGEDGGGDGRGDAAEAEAWAQSVRAEAAVACREGRAEKVSEGRERRRGRRRRGRKPHRTSHKHCSPPGCRGRNRSSGGMAPSRISPRSSGAVGLAAQVQSAVESRSESKCLVRAGRCELEDATT